MVNFCPDSLEPVQAAEDYLLNSSRAAATQGYMFTDLQQILLPTSTSSYGGKAWNLAEYTQKQTKKKKTLFCGFQIMFISQLVAPTHCQIYSFKEVQNKWKKAMTVLFL